MYSAERNRSIGRIIGISDGFPQCAFATAPAAPLVRLEDPAGQGRTVGLETLPHNGQAELVQAGEPGSSYGSSRGDWWLFTKEGVVEV